MGASLHELDINSILEKDAIVMLWVIDSMLPDALAFAKSWGLDFRTVGFYWTKERVSGKEHMALETTLAQIRSSAGFFAGARGFRAFRPLLGDGCTLRSEAIAKSQKNFMNA
jgi:N6-adenosine-specific RNA methylase IME4